ncbi:MAG: hypothetical protein QM784_25495 [Polyangiaceae bacterium]
MMFRHVFFAASISIASSFVLQGCTGANASSDVTTPSTSGTIRLPLRAKGASGTDYRLSSATFRITSVSASSNAVYFE